MSVADTSQALNKLGDIRKPEIDAGRPTQHNPPSAGFFKEDS